MEFHRMSCSDGSSRLSVKLKIRRAQVYFAIGWNAPPIVVPNVLTALPLSRAYS